MSDLGVNDWIERSYSPGAITRLRFGMCEALIGPRTMVGCVFVRPLYRQPDSFGFQDREPSA